MLRLTCWFLALALALLDGTRPVSALAPLIKGAQPELIATALQSFYRVGLMIA